jgi:hypothetical protein
VRKEVRKEGCKGIGDPNALCCVRRQMHVLFGSQDNAPGMRCKRREAGVYMLREETTARYEKVDGQERKQSHLSGGGVCVGARILSKRALLRACSLGHGTRVSWRAHALP